MAAKAIADFKKEYELLEFKGGVMEGQIISIEQFQALTKLPSRDVLNGQLVGMIASPIIGLVRGLDGLLGGLAIQLGAIRDQGLVSGEAPAAGPAAEEAPAAKRHPLLKRHRPKRLRPKRHLLKTHLQRRSSGRRG